MSKPTDWDSYYRTPYRLSGLTRHFTTRLLLRLIKRYRGNNNQLAIVELGGGGSTFYPSLHQELSPQRYIVVDNNQAGLDKLASTVNGDHLVSINHDIIKPPPGTGYQAGVVFSVGLIEHFPPDLTERAIAAHFDWATKDGLVIITYPTPTWLYRLSRWVSERMGWWIFHDETPLPLRQVEELVSHYGLVVWHRINWTSPFTQAIVVVRKGLDNPVVG